MYAVKKVCVKITRENVVLKILREVTVLAKVGVAVYPSGLCGYARKKFMFFKPYQRNQMYEFRVSTGIQGSRLENNAESPELIRKFL